MSAKTAEPDQGKGFLGVIEKVGNKVPHPVLMFLYLIIFVIVLSWVLNLAGVSVTEQIAVPVDENAEYNYYEDTTQPSVTVPMDPYEEDYEIQEQTIPIKKSAVSGWHPLHFLIICLELRRLQCGRRHVHCDDGRRGCGRIGAVERLDPQTGGSLAT